jgi:hypothetical protein
MQTQEEEEEEEEEENSLTGTFWRKKTPTHWEI